MAVDPSQMGQYPPVPFALPGQGGEVRHLPAGQSYDTQSGGYIYHWISNGYGGGTIDPARPPEPMTGATQGGKAPQLLKDKQGNVIGYWDPDVPNSATYFNPEQGGQSPVPVPLGGGYIYNPATGAVETLPPQATPSQPGYHNAGRAVLQTQPDGTVRVVYVDQAGLATDQAALARQQAELEEARERNRLTGQSQYQQGQYQNAQLEQSAFNNYWNNVIAAGQADESAQQNAFTRDYRLLYELPRTQVADENQARLNQYQAAANQGTYETGRFNAGQNAADARVRAMMETLPYRASPQFAQQYAARRAQEATRQPLTPYSAEAFQIRPPDFEGARRAGYAEAGVTGGLPTFEALLQRTPAFATMDPEELKRLQMQMGLTYVPPASLSRTLAGG